jgi:NAD(P)-dependent dehydrogenase (short-subunit alcohol dehydrogenase family)
MSTVAERSAPPALAGGHGTTGRGRCIAALCTPPVAHFEQGWCEPAQPALSAEFRRRLASTFVQIDGAGAIVTGASSGIGAATARELARRGARVMVVARRMEKLEVTADICRKSSPASFANPGDVSDRTFCESAVAKAMETFGAVDIVVNNAGISLHKDSADVTVEDIERVMAVNFFGPVCLASAALPGMLQRRRGSVVNVTSVSGYVPNPKEAAYGASKAALSRWSHGLSVDLYGTGVHVGVLSPGPIDTDIWLTEGEEPYKGRLYPPEIVGRGVARMIEREVTHMTVPRRFGAVGALYPLVGQPMRWGMRRFA